MKTNYNIEELIRNNREALNEQEPPVGHLERFEARLKKEHQGKKKKIGFNTLWKVAAAVVFIVLATNQVLLFLNPTGQNPDIDGSTGTAPVTLATVSPEYREVEFYFTNAISVGLNQWESLEKEGLISDQEKKALNSELAEFETRFKTLQADLAANPNDERVINAMLEYYQTKLGIITLIVDKLEEVKEQKNTHHETTL